MARKLRVVEWFSGIGGWAHALSSLQNSSSCDLEFEVVEAIDINTIANEVYSLNLGRAPKAKSVESLNIKFFDSCRADVWVMSPPCQPFTRNHEDDLTRDRNDPRTAAFQYITNILTLIRNLPTYIVLENVVGFENSSCCESFLSSLRTEGYSYQQLLLTPTQFGIPNERPRYFLIAARNDSLNAYSNPASPILTGIPGFAAIPPAPISSVLDATLTEADLESLRVPLSVLQKTASWCLDIVTAQCVTSACFTKSYSRYLKGSGSVLLEEGQGGGETSAAGDITPAATAASSAVTTTTPVAATTAASSLSAAAATGVATVDSTSVAENEVSVSETPICSVESANEFRSDPSSRHFDSDWTARLAGKRVRYFSAGELIRLFGFPASFRFPDTVSTRKRYELIGNSINVDVAVHLLKFLFSH